MSSQDPRAVRSRDAILAAARDLLRDHGPAAVTHQRVAERAGVGRATVYRHWSNPDQLLLAAMGGTDMPFFREPSSPVREWLRGELRRLGDELALPEVAAFSLTLMQGALWDPDLARRRDASVAAMGGRIDAALAIAVEAGELGARPSGTDAAARLVGPIMYRVTNQNAVVTDAFIAELVEALGPWRG